MNYTAGVVRTYKFDLATNTVVNSYIEKYVFASTVSVDTGLIYTMGQTENQLFWTVVTIDPNQGTVLWVSPRFFVDKGLRFVDYDEDWEKLVVATVGNGDYEYKFYTVDVKTGDRSLKAICNTTSLSKRWIYNFAYDTPSHTVTALIPQTTHEEAVILVSLSSGLSQTYTVPNVGPGQSYWIQGLGCYAGPSIGVVGVNYTWFDWNQQPNIQLSSFQPSTSQFDLIGNPSPDGGISILAASLPCTVDPNHKHLMLLQGNANLPQFELLRWRLDSGVLTATPLKGVEGVPFTFYKVVNK